MKIVKEGILESKTEDIRGTKNVKILIVIFPDSKYPLKLVDWEIIDEITEAKIFRSDGLKLKQNYVWEYDESISINKSTGQANINPNSGKPYINRNFQKAYEPGSPLDIREDIEKPAKVIKENDGVIKHDELLTHIENIEKYLAETTPNMERIKRLENIVAEDYDTNWEMVKNILQNQARLEAKIDMIVKGLKLDKVDFEKASEI